MNWLNDMLFSLSTHTESPSRFTLQRLLQDHQRNIFLSILQRWCAYVETSHEVIKGINDSNLL